MKTIFDERAAGAEMWKVAFRTVSALVCLALWILAVVFFAKGNYEMATLALVAEIAFSPSTSP